MADEGRSGASTIAALGGFGAGLFSSPFRSKLFLLALAAALAGGGMVAWNAYEGTGEPPTWAPWAMRIGASFVAAFVFAYLVRKAVLAALLIGGALIVGAVLLNKLGYGVSDEQLAAINDAAHSAADTIQTKADSTWEQIKTYLPSGGSAGLGFYRGARHGGVKAEAKA